MNPSILKSLKFYQLNLKEIEAVGSHDWVKITEKPCALNVSNYYCEKCRIVLYWLICDEDHGNKYLTCEERIIKGIIE
jgi:hypothetical protein